MLIRFRARNFRSLKDEQELSLVASSLKDTPESVTHVEALNMGLLRAAAIYGANASGKTNVIKALEYMAGAVQNSQRLWPPEGPIPREPFLLDPRLKDEPSSFEVDLLLDGVRFRYGFRLNDREVLEEWLDAYPRGKKQMWFRREAKAFTFGKNLAGENRAIENLTRPNSLFLSAATQNNHPALSALYGWFSSRLATVSREEKFNMGETVAACSDEVRRGELANFLLAADLGVTGLDLVEREVEPEVMKILEAAFNALPKPRKVPFPEKHPELSLRHKSQGTRELAFALKNESDGTRAFLGLLGPTLRSLGSGGTLCVDELDASLHPLLALEVVRLFNDPKKNPRGAQVIFTTHDINIMDKASLRRDQIWFTEKDAEGGTHLYPLTDFRPRKNENLERGYLQGRYGAIPFVGSTDFLEQTQPSEQ